MTKSTEATIRREGRKILNGTANANGHSSGHAEGLTLLSEIPNFPMNVMMRLKEVGIAALLSLEMRAEEKHKGNVYQAMLAVEGVSVATAKVAHRAIMGFRMARDRNAQAEGNGSLDGPHSIASERLDAEERAPVPDAEPDELVHLALASIAANPLNPRKHFDPAGLEELAKSIRAKGVLEPVIVRPHPDAGASPHGRYQLVAGERRVRAAALAGRRVVPAIVRRLSDRECLEVMVIENEQRENTSPLEKADGYQALLALPGMSIAALAERIGKSVSRIQELLKLRQLPEVARKAVEAGRLPVETATLIARIPGEKLRTKAALHVLTRRSWWDETPKPKETDEPMSSRQAREFLQQHCTLELKRAPFDRKALDLVEGAPSCEACPKRVGNLQKEDPEGYAGARADVSTDPECYQRKVEACQRREAEVAKRDGFKVLPVQDGLQLFERYDNDLSWNARQKFVALDAKCQEDKKRRTYGSLIGEACRADTVVAFDHAGHPRRLVPVDKARKALQEEHQIAIGQKARTVHDEERRKNEAAARRKHDAALKANGVVAERAAEIFAPLDAITDSKIMRGQLQALVRTMVKAARFEEIQPVNKRRALGNDREALVKLIDAGDMTPSQLLGIVAELAAAGLSHGWGSPYYGDKVDPLFPAFGIDKAALMKEAAAARKAKKKGATK
jgi:ParB/RepB/Spo0J family partition protein